MAVLFLDQTGALGGAEFALSDVAAPYSHHSTVALFCDGPFRELLERTGKSVVVLDSGLGDVRRDTGGLRGLLKLPSLGLLAFKVARLARKHDVIYANTQKALLVGALAKVMARRPLVFHLHDILSEEHFGRLNRKLSVSVANAACSKVIADSRATRQAFLDAGGDASKVDVLHYGFDAPTIEVPRSAILEDLGIDPASFVVGHFSRLSPWKGQEVLIRALSQCSSHEGASQTVALFVGDALFGEDKFANWLHGLAHDLGLEDRITFAGFRSDIPDLMAACDLVVHSSTSAEPFGRVIVEAMLTGTPVIAARAGGPLDIVDHGRTGWLTTPDDATELAHQIQACRNHPEEMSRVASAARIDAEERFSMAKMHAGIDEIVRQVLR